MFDSSQYYFYSEYILYIHIDLKVSILMSQIPFNATIRLSNRMKKIYLKTIHNRITYVYVEHEMTSKICRAQEKTHLSHAKTPNHCVINVLNFPLIFTRSLFFVYGCVWADFPMFICMVIQFIEKFCCYFFRRKNYVFHLNGECIHYWG